MGKGKDGQIKPKNERVHTTHWDVVVFDEYHYGAWREGAKGLFDTDEKEDSIGLATFANSVDEAEAVIPITTDHYLYLSGTPFRAIASGEFIEEQIFNRTYYDEQKRKAEWDPKQGANPYESLPQIVMMTYQLPDYIQHIAQ